MDGGEFFGMNFFASNKESGDDAVGMDDVGVERVDGFDNGFAIFDNRFERFV